MNALCHDHHRKWNGGKMSVQQEYSGSCQCGNVSYRITAQSVQSVICHCDDCRKQSGSAFGASLIVNSDEVVFQGRLKTWDRTTDTGRTNRAFFCPDCGNRIYHQNPDAPEVVRIRSGTLDGQQIPEPRTHFHTIRQMPWVSFSEEVTRHEKQPGADQLYAATDPVAQNGPKEEK
jgi:hypothetical protein